MADVSKPKLQLRSGLSINADKTPSPATKLLINHGKPNFTIQRSPKAQNGNVNPMSPSPSPTSPSAAAATEAEAKANNEFVVKSTTFNGIFKPSTISAATKLTLQQNGTTTTTNGNVNVNNSDNEAAKVVLRRAKVVQSELTENGDDNVPEFIRRQRRIQERLANQNILDFENRRSGYFTQVMITPSSPNRQSFMETMASPAVKPGLEIPPPPPSPQHDNIEEEMQQNLSQQRDVENNEVPVTLNGQVEEEEVAKAIEEVNKAVEGEDEEDKTEPEEHIEHIIQTNDLLVSNTEQCEETSLQIEEQQYEQIPVVAKVTSAMVETETPVEETQVMASVVTSAVEVVEEHQQQQQQNGHVEAVVTSAALIEDKIAEPKTNNGVVEVEQQQNGEALDNEITISHTNDLSGPSLPCPDPKGEKGVNFEPKTVVSFSQELGNNVNKYPDTVKLVKDAETPEGDNELRELTKLKFEIKTDEKDIEVKPVLITEMA